MEVYQIGTRDFFVKLLCKHKKGGFMRLMEVMNSLGLQVFDANVTTHNGNVLNILKVEVRLRSRTLIPTLILRKYSFFFYERHILTLETHLKI